MRTLILLALCLCAFTSAVQQDEMVPIDDHVRSMFDISHVELKKSVTDGSIVPLPALLANVGTRNVIADRIKDFLEGYRENVEHGSDSHPPLDPLEIDQFGPFSFRTGGIPSIRATVEIQNLHMEGLKWYVVDEVTFNLLRLNVGFHFTVPRVAITGDYSANARVALIITHRAAGDFRLFINRLEVSGDMRLGVSTSDGGHLTLRDLDINIDIHDTFIYMNGLVGSGFLNFVLNWILQNVSQDVIQNQREEISQIVTEVVFDIINSVLRGFSLDDLIG